MKNTFLITVGLGLVAAVAFASATTGPLFFRFVLFFVTPLPLAVASFGWGWVRGVQAGLVGSLLILILGGPTIALAFAVSQVFPIVLLCYLAGLSRPLAEAVAGDPDSSTSSASQVGSIEFYPVGRLVVWSAVLSGGLAALSLLLVGGDLEEVRKLLAEFVERTVKRNSPAAQVQTLSKEDIDAVVNIVIGVLPAATGLTWMASLLFNLWLAGRISLAAEHLQRPWPDLAAMDFPFGMSIGLAIALAATTFGGLASAVAASFAGPLFFAYTLLGLAVLHYVTRGKPWRPFLLWAVYAALLFTNIWSAIPITILGLAEDIFFLRARAGVPPPPGAHPGPS